jgi:hypothetical protein
MDKFCICTFLYLIAYIKLSCNIDMGILWGFGDKLPFVSLMLIFIYSFLD